MRRQLFRDLLVLFLCVIGAILAVTLTLDVRVTTQAAASVIQTRTVAAQKDIDTYFESVQKNLLIARKWGQAGMLSLEDVSALNAKFVPILEEMPEIGGVIIARDDGTAYYLRREGVEWLTRTVSAEEARGTGLWQRWDGGGELLASWKEVSSYEPRRRAWFKGAVAREHGDQVCWTKPYLFFSLDVPGVTVSAAWREEGSRTECVIAFDVLLDDIYTTVAALRPRPGGQAFLFTDKGWVFTPNKPVPEDEAGTEPDANNYLTDAAAMGPAVHGAVERWKQEGGFGDLSAEYVVQGRRWWAGFTPLTDEGGGLWLGIIAPEQDLLGKETWNRSIALLLIALILGTGTLGTVLLVRRHGRHLRDGPEAPAREPETPEQAVLNLIQQGEGHCLEFKSTMRVNLKKGKAEKGIELAWLKAAAAFLNSDGGTLLIGVDDHGAVVGIEADGFASDDKCRLHFKNLIGEHIGLEHSSALHLDILTVQGRRILRVDCQRSEKPVFLTLGKEESFYIRSGPSSMKLTVSKALQYLEGRK